MRAHHKGEKRDGFPDVWPRELMVIKLTETYLGSHKWLQYIPPTQLVEQNGDLNVSTELDKRLF